ncbi:MAG: PTS sugar transporter subunit IIB [Deltaproteobacteria bacterium]|jgi:PTS system mannose-specific IIB component|nr:PTS sugar transporter subunit IIB [Deltaproteobacteria bacterium]
MIWYRIDNRLVHGQIIESWLPYTKASVLVIANDELAEQELRREIMLMAVPSRVRTEFLRLDELLSFVEKATALKLNVLVLFADCRDARKAHDMGTPLLVCNVGNIHYSEGKKQLCAHIALSADDEICLRLLQSRGVELDFRCIPADKPEVNGW